MKKLSRSQCDALLVAAESKYCDLVWYYRTVSHTPTLGKGHPVGDRAIEIRDKYPHDCAHLLGPNGPWQHGFNSGCLAAYRYAAGLRGDRLEQEAAISNYPFLDT